MIKVVPRISRYGKRRPFTADSKGIICGYGYRCIVARFPRSAGYGNNGKCENETITEWSNLYNRGEKAEERYRRETRLENNSGDNQVNSDNLTARYDLIMRERKR